MIRATWKGLVGSRKKAVVGTLLTLFFVLSTTFASLALSQSASAAPPTTSTPSQTCEGGAMGWIICPIATTIQAATDVFYSKIIIPFLTVSPLTSSRGDPIYSVWNNIRNVANIAFVLAFLAIIYSQATSMGLGNYGVKRLLPKMIIVVILTNISYFVCAALIDTFNILGAGIGGLMLGSLPPGGDNSIYVSTGSGLALIGGAAVGIGALLASGSLLPALFGLLVIGFVAILVAVIVLVVRQIAVITLVMLAPLAFVAWLLPNTEKWFNKWLSTMLKLLMMFPMIIAIFVGAKIFSAVITQAAFFGDDSTGNAIKGAIGFLVQAVPLFALPFTFALAGGAFSKIAGMIATQGTKHGGRLGKEGFKRTALGRNHEMRTQARDTAKQRAFLEAATTGKGFSGKTIRLRNKFGNLNRTATAQAAQTQMNEKLVETRKKMDAEKSENFTKNYLKDAMFAKSLIQGRDFKTMHAGANDYQKNMLDGLRQAGAFDHNGRITRLGAQSAMQVASAATLLEYKDYNHVQAAYNREDKQTEFRDLVFDMNQVNKGNGLINVSKVGFGTGTLSQFGLKQQPSMTEAQGREATFRSTPIGKLTKDALLDNQTRLFVKEVAQQRGVEYVMDQVIDSNSNAERLLIAKALQSLDPTLYKSDTEFSTRFSDLYNEAIVERNRTP